MLLPAALLALTWLALALVPDAQIVRSKVMWSEAGLFATGAAVLIGQALAGRWSGSAAWAVLVAALPAVVAIGWLLCATPFSRTLARDEVERLLLAPLALMAAAAAAVRPASRRAIVAVIVLSIIPVAAHAVAQHLADLLALPLRRVERPGSSFGNPDFLGAYLVLVTPLAIAATLFGRGLLRWGGALAAGFALPALYATQTRGAWLGMGAAVALGIAWLAPSRAARRWLFACLGLGAIALLAISVDIVRRPSEHHLIWRDSLRLVADHPWGIGPGQFQPAFLPYASGELLAAYPRESVIINDAHCEPLQALAELGWPGLLATIMMLVLLGRAGVAAVRATDSADRPLAIGVFSGLFGHAVMSLGSPDLRFVATQMIFFLLAGLLLAHGPPAEREIRLPGRFAMLGAGLAVLGFGVWRTEQRVQILELLSPPASLPPTAVHADEIAHRRAVAAGSPQDPKAQFELGVALGGDRRWAEAADAFQAAYVLGGGDVVALRDLALMQALAGRGSEALPNLRVVLERLPDDADARYMLALLEFCMGDVASATRDTETLLAAHPDHRLGRLLRERLRE